MNRLHLITSEIVLLIWLGAPACLVVDACFWHLCGQTVTGISWDPFRALGVAFWSLVVPMMAALSQP